MILLDTHTLLWWSHDPEKLSSTARKLCAKMQGRAGFVSSISLWELGMKINRGKLDIGFSIEEYHRRLMKFDWLEIVPVDAGIWLESLALEWDHRDPADRAIVATAKHLDLPLLTKDETVTAFFPGAVW